MSEGIGDLTAYRGVARLIAAVVLGYLVVLQAAIGGLASARHVAMAGDPLSILCLTSGDQDQGGGSSPSEHAALCCVAGCVPAAATLPAGPDPVPFVYDPRPTPRRALAARDGPAASAADLRWSRPRGPPAAG